MYDNVKLARLFNIVYWEVCGASLKFSNIKCNTRRELPYRVKILANGADGDFCFLTIILGFFRYALLTPTNPYGAPTHIYGVSPISSIMS